MFLCFRLSFFLSFNTSLFIYAFIYFVYLCVFTPLLYLSYNFPACQLNSLNYARSLLTSWNGGSVLSSWKISKNNWRKPFLWEIKRRERNIICHPSLSIIISDCRRVSVSVHLCHHIIFFLEGSWYRFSNYETQAINL